MENFPKTKVKGESSCPLELLVHRDSPIEELENLWHAAPRQGIAAAV